MKNPIKNGKEVFAVLSMATVMSISMSVKVDAASDTEIAAESAAKTTIESTVQESKENNTEGATSKEKVLSTKNTKEDTTSADNKKDTEATGQGSSDLAKESSSTEVGVTTLANDGEEKDSALEVGEENVKEVLGSTKEEFNDEANSDKVSTTSEGNVEGKDRETEVTQAKAAEISEENLEKEEEKPA